MEPFPHLRFLQKIIGRPRLHGGGEQNERSEENKRNRSGHSGILLGSVGNIKDSWGEEFDNREEQGLAPIEKEVVPVFLQVNPGLVEMVEFNLHQLGIEIISQQDDGYIIGASLDGLRSLEEKINGFVNHTHGTGRIAELWEIISGDRALWKPEHILSEELFLKWPEIDDNRIYHLEISIAFDRPIRAEPSPDVRGYATKLERYQQALIDRDEQLRSREQHFEDFIRHYGEITSSIIELEDSFGCEVAITGQGLKDLVVNYQFVFEVSEVEKIEGVIGNEVEAEDFDIEVIPPTENAPEVGVIDSGIMENHKYLSHAIIPANSVSYLTDTSTADKVLGGGHGTKVAGAILYPKGVSVVEAPYQLPCYIRNIRVLDENNKLVDIYPTDLIHRIVHDNTPCSIFNLSINSTAPFRLKHMSSWAAMLDSLTHDKGVLFIISAGNIGKQQILHYLSNGQEYPLFLQEPNCRLANPAQSSFSLVVGSVNIATLDNEHWVSLGNELEVSPFSRIGTGIWGMIKPDVVEYGGGLAISKNTTPSLTEKPEISPELIRSTYHGGHAIGKDAVGTSFSTPKVSHIVSQLKMLYPEENVNLLRALVVQSARLPRNFFEAPVLDHIRFFGYGIPQLERATINNEHRITFYNTGQLRAEEGHLYLLKIPEELYDPTNEYDILLEVTLAYSAKVRRTRQKTKSYLATWLDWETSKMGETFGEYQNYALREIENTATAYDRDLRNGLETFDWKIKNRLDSGSVTGIRRNDSTVQKDWAIVKSFDLPEEITFCIRGHKGWDKNREEVPYALVVSIEILGSNIPIYESIRIENEIELPV